MENSSGRAFKINVHLFHCQYSADWDLLVWVESAIESCFQKHVIKLSIAISMGEYLTLARLLFKL